MRGKLFFGVAGAALLAAFGASSASAQAADPAGDASTSAILAVDGDLTGEIAPAGDTDWYRLEVAAGTAYRLALDAAISDGDAAFDTLLVVYDANGAEIARNDDANGTLNSALTYRTHDAGTVFVEARGLSDEATGGYTLRVSAAPIPPDDAGGDASTGARLTPGQTLTGAIGEEEDQDWYRLSARTGQIYRIALNGADGDGGLNDPLLRIVDAAGTELAANDDGPEGLNSLIQFAPHQSGDVFVIANGFGGSTGAYTLSAEASRLPPDNAGDNARTRARLGPGQSVDGAIEYPGDRDWFRIRLEGGQSYRFTLSSPDGEGRVDPLLHLHDQNGTELLQDDDSGGSLNSFLEFTAPESRDYFLEAQAFGDTATGGYTIAAHAGDIPADVSTDMSLSAAGDYREGVLSPSGDKDWYRVELSEGQSLRIGLNAAEGADALGDPLLVLYGADGAELARDDDGGEGLNARLEYTAAAEGPVYVEARGFSDDAEGHYVVTVLAGEIGAGADSAEALGDSGSEGRTSRIGGDGDVDWFMVEMIEGRPYRFNVTSSDFDPVVTLLDSKGVEVASDDDGGTGANAYLSFTSPTGGPYFAAVRAYDSAGSGAYTITASDTDVPGNINTDETLDVSVGDERQSNIDFAGDLDDYRVELQAGVRYLIEVRGMGDNPVADPLLTLLNSSGETVTTDDDGGPGLDARLRFTPESTDVYYIQASGLGGGTGGYRVSITPEG